jgi:hypothetical protein
MFSWFKKKKIPPGVKPVLTNYGRYIYKPVLGRALRMVLNTDDAGLYALIKDSLLLLNNSKITADQLNDRLHSGQYLVERIDNHNSWSFYI